MKEKLAALESVLREIGPCAVAFSGGVDSSLVLRVAQRVLRGRVLGFFVDSPLLADEDRSRAATVARSHGFEVRTLYVDPLPLEAVAHNHRDRCYHCKKQMLAAILSAAKAEGLATVCDGSNADDGAVYRPGRRALAELSVRSPLAEAGLTKENIRSLAAHEELCCAETPARPCMLTRFSYDQPQTLTADKLAQAAAAERLIAPYCDGDFRLRQDGQGACWLAVNESDVERVFAHRAEIREQLLAQGFQDIKLDLLPFRSGAFDKEKP